MALGDERMHADVCQSRLDPGKGVCKIKQLQDCGNGEMEEVGTLASEMETGSW